LFVTLCIGSVLAALAGCPSSVPTSARRVSPNVASRDDVIRPAPRPSSPPVITPPPPVAGPPLDVSNPNDCCVPAGFGDGDSHQGPSDGEIAAALYHVDSDGDGESDGAELARGADPLDPTDGDADGDGIENGDDPDVDGDGVENGADDDVDGDGIANGDDDDIDGDGLLNADDDDDDGDGESDDEDEDDDADGEDDCECEHGVCSEFKGLCFCEPGWKGEDCDEFTCADLNNCNHGTCVGPNACRCDQGWRTAAAGAPCNEFHCLDLAGCNGHGSCTGPNVCDCDADWKGTPDCRQPTCVRTPSHCDDGDPCTTDDCDAATGCTHEPVVCSLFETCVGGDCVPSCDNTTDCDQGQACKDGGCVDECDSDGDCRDGDPCTIDGCNTSTSECENEPLVCPIPEECVRGACVDGCENDFDCEFNEFCVDGGCFPECASDSDCSEGETCDTSAHACLPAETEEGDEEEE